MPALSTEYYKARRNMVLWSAVLFAWEVVGIDVSAMKTEAGSVGAFVNAISNPRAIPWVVLLVVAYFLFHFMLEWGHSAPERRATLAARVDFFSDLIVALNAIGLYLLQELDQVRVADVAPSNPVVVLVAAIGWVLVVTTVYALRRTPDTRDLREWKAVMGTFLVVIGVSALWGSVQAAKSPWPLLVGGWVALIPAVGGALGLRRVVHWMYTLHGVPPGR